MTNRPEALHPAKVMDAIHQQDSTRQYCSENPLTVCLSVVWPVPAVKAGSTLAGSVPAPCSTTVPSTPR
jgi:hypothetical protein